MTYCGRRVWCCAWSLPETRPTRAVSMTMVLMCVWGFLGCLVVGWRQSPVVMSAGFAVTWLASDPGTSPLWPSDLGQVTSLSEAPFPLLSNGGAKEITVGDHCPKLSGPALGVTVREGTRDALTAKAGVVAWGTLACPWGPGKPVLLAPVALAGRCRVHVAPAAGPQRTGILEV